RNVTGVQTCALPICRQCGIKESLSPKFRSGVISKNKPQSNNECWRKGHREEQANGVATLRAPQCEDQSSIILHNHTVCSSAEMERPVSAKKTSSMPGVEVVILETVRSCAESSVNTSCSPEAVPRNVNSRSSSSALLTPGRLSRFSIPAGGSRRISSVVVLPA